MTPEEEMPKEELSKKEPEVPHYIFRYRDLESGKNITSAPFPTLDEAKEAKLNTVPKCRSAVFYVWTVFNGHPQYKVIFVSIGEMEKENKCEK